MRTSPPCHRSPRGFGRGPQIPLHAARHTYAEIALAAGVRLDVVSRQLGHASISTTANVYTHDTDEAAAEAAELVARTIEGR